MEKYFRYSNGNIHYTDQGSGEVIMLIHGYPETSEIWKGFAKKLSANFRVITVDIPGHGKSDMYGNTLAMEFIATVLHELLIFLGIKKIFMTGHSLGGYITLAFVELYSEMLSGYCLFHSQPFADTPETLEKRKSEINLVKEGKKDLIYPENILKMFAHPNLNITRKALKRSNKIASSIPGEGIIGVLRGMMLRPSRVSVMEEGKIPCLWILGAKDNYINCEQISARIKLPSNAKLIILQNSGHLGFIEEEERSLKILTEFVRETV